MYPDLPRGSVIPSLSPAGQENSKIEIGADIDSTPDQCGDSLRPFRVFQLLVDHPVISNSCRRIQSVFHSGTSFECGLGTNWDSPTVCREIPDEKLMPVSVPIPEIQIEMVSRTAGLLI